MHPGNTPLVSILIPAHNAEAHLERPVASALAQTYENIEIIIIDDASTDHTGTLAEKLALQDPRIRILHNETNRLRSGALNVGIAESRGTYVSFLDADDEYRPDKTAQQVEFLETHSDVDVVYGDMECIQEDGTRSVWKALPGVGNALEKLRSAAAGGPPSIFSGGFIPSCSPLIRREVFDSVRFDETMRNMEDLDLWIQIVGAGFALERLPIVTYSYWRHPNQKSRNQERMQIAAERVREKIVKGEYLK